MKNVLGGFISYSKGVIVSLDSKYNFKQPEVVSFSVNGKKTEDKELELTGKNTRWYIGQIFHHGESIYSEDFVLGSLGYLFEKTKKGKKVVIEIASSVGKLLNPENSQDGAMSFGTQKEYIENLASHYHKKGKESLEVVNLEDRHSEIFQELRNNGISGLQTDNEIILDKDNFSSLDIGKLIHQAIQENSRFFKRLISTKPGKLKGPGDTIEPSDFYAVIEIALRITDFLNGITNQGGEKRQTRYDKIILDIINGKLNKIPAIKQLNEFINKIKGENEFSTIHFDSKKYLEIKEKKQERKKTNKIVATASIAIVAVLIGFTGANIIKEKKKKSNVGETINMILKNKEMIARYNFMFASLKTLKEKKEFMNGAVNNIYNLFIKRYGIGEFSEEDFKYMILSELFRGENTDYMLRDLAHYTNNAYDFIDEVLLPNNKILFLRNGIDINPYGKLKPYISNFWKTFYMTKDIYEELDNDIENLKLSFQYLGTYIAKDGEIYNIAISGPSGNNNMYSKYTGYLVAENVSNDYHYNAQDSKIVAEDYHRNIYVREFIKDIMHIFTTLYNKSYLDIKIKRTMSDEIIRYLGVKNIIGPIKWSYKEKLTFLQDIFIPNNQELLKEAKISNTVYEKYIKYTQEFQNTLDIPIDILKKENIFDTKYIGIYQTIDGKEYDILEFEYNGKKYIIGSSVGNYPRSVNSYYIDLGKKISKDFLKRNKPGL